MKNQHHSSVCAVWRPGKRLLARILAGYKFTHFCILDSEGSLVAEGRFRTTPGALGEQFEGVSRCRIALEVGTHSRWVSGILEDLAHEVIVANARKGRLIKESDNKTDKMDARTLARLARVDPSLLSPQRKIYIRPATLWFGHRPARQHNTFNGELEGAPINAGRVVQISLSCYEQADSGSHSWIPVGSKVIIREYRNSHIWRNTRHVERSVI